LVQNTFSKVTKKNPWLPVTRNLNRLNRNLAHVVVLDYDKELYPTHKENVLVMPQRDWLANANDTDLYDIVPILRHLAREVNKDKDLREILRHYEDVDPTRVVRLATGRKP